MLPDVAYEISCMCVHFTPFIIPLYRLQDAGFKLCMQKKIKKRLPITFGNLTIWNKAFENDMQLLVISLFVVSDKADKIIPNRQFYTELMY